MFNFPPLPGWDGLHPLVVHFPIALLLFAPVIVLIALIWKSKTNALLIAAFIIMVFGTIGAYVATSTGEAGDEIIKKTPEIKSAIKVHEDMAETASAVYAVLTGTLGLLIFLPIVLKKEITRRLTVILGIVFLIINIFTALMLANTAHTGGLLVHQYGIKAMLKPDPNRIHYEEDD